MIALFGPPQRYLWGTQTYGPNDLPDRYIMNYSDGFSIYIAFGHIAEIRFQGIDVGYAFRDKIRIGSTLDEVADTGPVEEHPA